MRSSVSNLLLVLISPVVVAAAPDGYYDAATATGDTLKNQLHTIIRSGHRSISYDSVRSQMLNGTLELPPDGTGVLLVYNGQETTSSAWPGWNREHTWPRSRGVGENQSSSGYAHNDLHALRACDAGINSSRSNKPFGTSSNEWDPDARNNRSDMSFRGQIARSMFYMATRYEGTDGDGSGDLELATFAGPNTMGDVRELVEWHYNNPPDPWELQRHEKVSSIHNNRNPFIDHPEWVWTIWGVPNFGQNNSQVHVGTSPASNGSSGIFVEFGSFILGATVDPQTVVINKVFEHPTAARLDASAGLSIIPNDTAIIFPFGPSVAEIEVQPTPTEAGQLVETIIIENIEPSSSAIGRGGQDAGDQIIVLASILDHANASFAPDSDLDLLETEAVQLLANTGNQPVTFSLYALESTEGFTADLDIDETILLNPNIPASISTAPDSIPAGGSHEFTVLVNTDLLTPDLYATAIQFTTSDIDLPGANAPSSETVTAFIVYEIIEGANCDGDANNDNTVNVADFISVLLNFGSAGMQIPGDANNDGTVNVADFIAVLLNFGNTCG